MLESTIGSDEYITHQLLHEEMVFQMLPPEIEKSLGIVSPERLDQPRIDGGVYNDAHAN